MLWFEYLSSNSTKRAMGLGYSGKLEKKELLQLRLCCNIWKKFRGVGSSLKIDRAVNFTIPIYAAL
jgi:hypothetical protein